MDESYWLGVSGSGKTIGDVIHCGGRTCEGHGTVDLPMSDVPRKEKKKTKKQQRTPNKRYRGVVSVVRDVWR